MIQAANEKTRRSTEAESKKRPRRTLIPLLRQTIEEIDLSTGGAFRVSPYFLEYSFELNDLCRAVRDPGTGNIAAFLDCPTTLAGILVYPITVAARFWLIHHAFPVFADNQNGQRISIIYALANRKIRLAQTLVDPAEIRRTVEAFARTLNASDAAIDAVIRRLCDAPEFGSWNGKEAESPAVSADEIGPTLAMLHREYGEPPSFWLFECPKDHFDACVMDYNARVGQASGGFDSAINPFDPAVIAFQALRKRVKEIKAEVTAPDGDE